MVTRAAIGKKPLPKGSPLREIADGARVQKNHRAATFQVGNWARDNKSLTSCVSVTRRCDAMDLQMVATEARGM